MATSALSIISRAHTILLESGTGTRWTQAELLDWLNAGQHEIVTLRHDAGARIASHPLTAGTKQSIPSDGFALIDVLRNMGVDGATPGAAVRKVSRDMMDAISPSWGAASPAATIKHYIYNPQTPRIWYCHPPANGTTQVELVYAALPASVTNVNNPITIGDEYANNLLDYILYRAYSKDSETPGNAELAAAYRTAFDNGLGLKAQAAAVNVSEPEAKG